MIYGVKLSNFNGSHCQNPRDNPLDFNELSSQIFCNQINQFTSPLEVIQFQIFPGFNFEFNFLPQKEKL